MRVIGGLIDEMANQMFEPTARTPQINLALPTRREPFSGFTLQQGDLLQNEKLEPFRFP